MTGSGNDFVFFDARGSGDAADALENTADISAICAPHLGVGADGVVFIAESDEAQFAIRYYNADGTRASLCGNASLCAAQSAVRLGLVAREQTFHFMSDAGRIAAAIDAQGVASVRLAPVTALEAAASEGLAPREQRIGYAVVGVPHLVVLVADVAAMDVAGRGRILRYGVTRAPAGANVNFVSVGATPGSWRIRTYERGVEAETFACGTGAVATAACLQAWDLAPRGDAVQLLTASGKTLIVRLPEAPDDGYSELSGEGRVVFDGVLDSLR
ncbi:MAG: diaminopimelate epimerase [Gemmatimonadaceae bacterium]|nr:diaminopimelate epimerase [Gemmatimonadaceae bacterium]